MTQFLYMCVCGCVLTNAVDDIILLTRSQCGDLSSLRGQKGSRHDINHKI